MSTADTPEPASQDVDIRAQLLAMMKRLEDMDTAAMADQRTSAQVLAEYQKKLISDLSSRGQTRPELAPLITMLNANPRIISAVLAFAEQTLTKIDKAIADALKPPE